MKARVLVVCSDADWAGPRSARLEQEGYTVRVVQPDSEGLELLDEFEPHVVVVDLPRLGQAGIEYLEQGKLRTAGAGFVGITSAASAEQVADAVTSGADLALPHAGQPEDLVPLVRRALEKAETSAQAQRFQQRAESILSQANFDSIIGSHPNMQSLLKKVAQVAQTRANVLVYGESGTGKELIAAAIHQNSKRRHAAFVRLNCAALSDSVLESELFGHEKGAFTGAIARREGRFKQADGGTLFLDEISELSARVQVKLLRFLQEKEFERVGGNDTLKVDVRVVAATNRDLLNLVQEGTFREDLYYRLNVVRLEVPPLRSRPSDILLLADSFLRQASRDNEVDVVGFTEDAKKKLVEYPWPGNVRELQNTIEQAVVLTETGKVDVEDLPIRGSSGSVSSSLRLMIPGATMAEIERFAITETLRACGGSTAKAAEVLGISRRTVQYRVKEWGLSKEQEHELLDDSG